MKHVGFEVVADNDRIIEYYRISNGGTDQDLPIGGRRPLIYDRTWLDSPLQYNYSRSRAIVFPNPESADRGGS